MFIFQLKLVANMTGNFGRKQRFSAFVVTGNKQGLAGMLLLFLNFDNCNEVIKDGTVDST